LGGIERELGSQILRGLADTPHQNETVFVSSSTVIDLNQRGGIGEMLY